MNQKKVLVLLFIIVGLVFIWAAINPLKGYGLLFLETIPGILGVIILAATYKRFKFSTIVYVFVALHFVILIVGGHYSYAENPLFNWLRETFDLSRNYYDRVGHIAQGFFPALIIRELLLRKTKLERGKWLFFLVVCVALATSAFYEFTEWWAAISLSPETGNAFLATQGDIWDTQWDMFLAMLGAIAAQLLFAKIQDQQLQVMKK